MKNNLNLLLIEKIYEILLREILSRDISIDAEKLSNLSLNILEYLAINRNLQPSSFLLKKLELGLKVEDKRLNQQIFNCYFPNPIGLAAGFDKNAIAAGIWDKFGFGFAELGTITWHPQEGNPKPRLFRLAKEQAALNRMGFNNLGANQIKKNLNKQGFRKEGCYPITIGLNFGKSKITNLNEAANDYALSIELLSSLADYAVINVSSPNTPGLRELQGRSELIKLIERILKIPGCPPLFIKIAPDLSELELDLISDVALEHNLAGIIAVNTSINRLGLEKRIILQTGLALEEEEGGLSGSPLCERALQVMRRLKVKSKNQLHLIGVGGINSPQSAWERITAGASLIQIYTGWIFQGPTLVPRILDGLVRQIEKHGFKDISEAIGSEAPWK